MLGDAEFGEVARLSGATGLSDSTLTPPHAVRTQIAMSAMHKTLIGVSLPAGPRQCVTLQLPALRRQ
jgi:hypothetical protein